MNWPAWDQLERILIERDVAPILAVVPDNIDPKLRVGEENPAFWQRVRKWQARGWAIGLHGFRHQYVNGHAGIVGLNPRSEFAGLPAEEQHRKIEQALAVLGGQGVRADIWIAPGHSFDEATLDALYRHGIGCVSDGYFLNPVTWKRMVWVPQQLWRFRRFAYGTWTVCYHHNSFGQREIDAFRRDMDHYRGQLIALPAAVAMARPYGPTDALVSKLWLWTLQRRRAVARTA
jgi:predicted deacetylase